MNYKIAELNSTEYDAVKKVEEQLKKETGQDFVMIAWKKEC